MISERVLKLRNGIECLVIQDESMQMNPQTLFCQWMVGSGSSSDPAGKKGLAHVLEHVVSQTLPDLQRMFPEKLRDAWKSNRVVYPNARTELDYTRFSMIVPAQLHDETMQYFGRWLQEVPLQKRHVAACVQEVIEEKQQKEAMSPFAKAFDLLYEESFKSHPYRWYTVGRFEQLRKIGLAECLRFFAEHYRPENLILTCLLSGGQSGSDLERLVASIEKNLSHVRGVAKPRVKRANHRPEAARGFRSRVIAANKRSSFVVGFQIPGAASLPLAAMRVLNQLWVGQSSRIRELLGARVETLGGLLPMTRQPALYEVLGILSEGVDPKDSYEIIRELLVECDRIRDGQSSDKEIEVAKEAALRDWKKISANPLERLEKLSVCHFLGIGASKWALLPEEISRVTRAEVLKSARSFLTPSRATIICCA